MRDAVVRGDTSHKSLGKKIVLPATFTGGPRYMIQNNQDAMAICRWAGNLDLFITFTTTKRPLMIMDIQFIEEEMMEHLYIKGDVKLDNSYVVPHNINLLIQYQAIDTISSSYKC